MDACGLCDFLPLTSKNIGSNKMTPGTYLPCLKSYKKWYYILLRLKKPPFH